VGQGRRLQNLFRNQKKEIGRDKLSGLPPIGSTKVRLERPGKEGDRNDLGDRMITKDLNRNSGKL